MSNLNKWMTLVLCLMVLVSSGCQPLRKKFIRQKKKQQVEEANPILTPIDYAPAQVSPQERYEHHYALWRVWHRDLAQEMMERENTFSKRQLYLLEEEIAQLEEMKKWVVPQKQEALNLRMEKLYKIRETLQRPLFDRENLTVKRQLDRLDKDIRQNFKPQVMEGYYISNE